MPDNDHLNIDLIWLHEEHGPPEERATTAQLTIHAADVCLTTVYDHLARTQRNNINVAAVHLANWFASNWWRIRWEPQRKDAATDWRLAHEMASAGGGFAWPTVTLFGDGESIRIRAHAGRPDFVDIEFKTDADLRINTTGFERAVDAFITMVISRLQAEHPNGECELAQLWDIVLHERADEAVRELRRLEAVLGCDPDTLESSTLESLKASASWMGRNALTELFAASTYDHAEEWADFFAKRASDESTRVDLGFLFDLRGRIGFHHAQEPWQRGARAARLLRNELGITSSMPVTNNSLAQLFGIHLTEVDANEAAPIAAALRRHDDRSYGALVRKHHPRSRRFEVARLAGDALMAPENDALLPVTDVYSARQQAQRSFAQELLCPESGLREFFKGNLRPDEEDLEAAADHFDVSEYAIITTLVNKKLVPRDYLQYMG